MMPPGAVLAVDRAPGETRVVALDRDGRLIDLALERPGGATDLGDIHRGRVIARAPALAGAFVRLAEADGFLPDSAGGRDVTEGATVAVRVVRAAQGGKGPRLKVADMPAGSGPPARLAPGPGALARLAALHPDAVLNESWDTSTREQVDALAEAGVDVAGGCMTITPTPALVAIDIDLATLAGGRDAKTRAHVATNQALLTEIARHIRLRNLAGGIVIDFAGLSARRRAALLPGLEAALQSDPMQPRLLGLTALGHAEILRPRGHAPLHEALAGPHAAALAAGRAMARAVASDPSRRPVLAGSPALLEAFRRDGALQSDLRDALGETARTRADPSMRGLRWSLEGA